MRAENLEKESHDWHPRMHLNEFFLNYDTDFAKGLYRGFRSCQ